LNILLQTAFGQFHNSESRVFRQKNAVLPFASKSILPGTTGCVPVKIEKIKSHENSIKFQSEQENEINFCS
jgi:hypothetical protein